MEARNNAFQILKPPCVKLSQVALALRGPKGNTKDVVDALTDVLRALESTSKTPEAINDKIADYVFFPLSHVLRQLERLPVRAKELTLSCILVLLRTAWRSQLAPALGIQLLILLSFSADFKGNEAKGGVTSEELQSITLVCLREVFNALKGSDEGRSALVSATNMPHLGKAISTILDNAYEGASATVQATAIEALQSFILAIDDREALAVSFLPGIMSCLTKVLTPSTKTKRSTKVLEGGIKVLATLLPLVLGDNLVDTLPVKANGTADTEAPTLSKTWVEATAPQVKMALAHIIKLQHHEREVVRHALAKLCIDLITNCTQSLSDSILMLLETLSGLAARGDMIETELDQILMNRPQLADMLRSSLLSWITSLPRVMLQADDTGKARLMMRIAFTYSLLVKQHVDLSVIDRAVGLSLRDAVLTMCASPAASRTISEFTDANMDLQILASSSHSDKFSPVLDNFDSSIGLNADITRLVEVFGEVDAAPLLIGELISLLLADRGDSKVASFWVLLALIKQNTSRPDFDMNVFIDLGSTLTRSSEDFLDQLYSFSMEILTQNSEHEQDWRMSALALETVAFQATRHKEDFRPELVDALYPVLHMMGSTNPRLQKHAMVCLNILADACGYVSSGDLIVSNVDYLVNAVAIRLNTVDLSPQAPLVMLMMVKLSGSSLLPYLDDLVDSIFTSLEAFHGYPKLVGLLFSVLKSIVEEGAKAPPLLLEIQNGEPTKHRKRRSEVITFEDLLTSIQALQQTNAHSEDSIEEVTFPTKPWKRPQNGVHPYDRKKQDSDEQNGSSIGKTANDDVAENKPPASKTYRLMLNISTLTQHYLGSESSELRISLLQLLSTTIPVLSKHDDSFLPLIHTIWPTVIHRLEDNEPYVVAGALKVIGEMCMFAGNFMKNRVEEIWPALRSLYRLRVSQASNSANGGNGLVAIADLTRANADVTGTSKAAIVPTERYYVQAPARIIRAAYVEMLIQITEHVTVIDEIYDEILAMLLPMAEARGDVKQALETRNPDALWLAQFRQGRQEEVLTTRTPANRTDDNGSNAFEFVRV